MLLLHWHFDLLLLASTSSMPADLSFEITHFPAMPVSCPLPRTISTQVSSASAAVSSFDDVCEALGDIAKLDNLVARGGPAAAAAAAVVAPPGAPVAFDLSVALRWG